MSSWLEILSTYPRIAIVGGPKTGKSTLSGMSDGRVVIHTDDFRDIPWADVPIAVNRAVMASGGRYIVEGVQVARALRKGLAPDAVVFLDVPMRDRTVGQDAMAKGVRTVMRDWVAKNSTMLPAMYGRTGDWFFPIHPRMI